MTSKKRSAAKNNSQCMNMEEFMKFSGPGEPLELLRGRQEEDAEWAERAFQGKEPLAPPIRLQRGRPKTGEDAPPTVVKAIRLPVSLLEMLQARAEAQGMTLNALLQLAVSEYLAHHKGA